MKIFLIFEEMCIMYTFVKSSQFETWNTYSSKCMFLFLHKIVNCWIKAKICLQIDR